VGGAESSGEGALYPPQGGVVASNKCAMIMVGGGYYWGGPILKSRLSYSSY
jgi:hypothetical protein